ncbi:MAG TPA: hypothetical protein VFZ03_16090 [Dongiaceae bacterium]
MTYSERATDRLCKSLEPWVVLAAGVLITSCCRSNFSVIQLLKAPVQYGGAISGGIGVADMPSWFPVQEAVLEIAGGTLYAKLRELPLKARTQATGPQTMRLEIEFVRVPLPAGASMFSLTYSPWFRFLSEPLNFDIVGRVAPYIADCFRFLLARNGISAAVDGDGDERHVRAADEIEIAVAGMQSLRSVALSMGSMRTLVDLESRRIEIDRRMFPAAYDAGRALSETSDRLINIDTTIDDTLFSLAVAGSAAHVQA